jgi:hypothetical protein
MNDAVGPEAAVRRAGRLAAWGSAVLQGRCSPDDAADAIVGEDEPHRVAGMSDEPVAWSVALGLLRRRGARRLVLVCPVPGDLAGLPGPPDLNRDVLRAGAAAIADSDPALALIPLVDVFGPVGDAGITVSWEARSANGPVAPGRQPTLSEADRALAESLSGALRRLAELDVARWRPEVATLRDDLDGPGEEHLPPDFPDRGLRLLARAQRMSAVLALGRSDLGGAVTVDEAQSRQQTLQQLASAVRHAETAAWNAGSEARR